MTPPGELERARELKSCPFCGNDGFALSRMTEEKSHMGRRVWQAYVECYMCGARGPQTALYDSREAALRKLDEMHDDEGWNTRSLADGSEREAVVAWHYSFANSEQRTELYRDWHGTCARAIERGEHLAHLPTTAEHGEPKDNLT